MKPYINKRRLIKTRSEISDREKSRTIEKINENEEWLFEIINKIDKTPAHALITKFSLLPDFV